MNRLQVHGWVLFSLLFSSLVFAYPQAQTNQISSQYLPMARQSNGNQQQYKQQLQPMYEDSMNFNENDRKFAEKPNALKKVALDDIDEDIQTNQISDNGFSWTNMLGSLMTMFFNNAQNIGPNKSDDLDNGNFAPSPWANVISVGELRPIKHPIQQTAVFFFR